MLRLQKNKLLAMVLLLRYWGDKVEPKINMNLRNRDDLEPAALIQKITDDEWNEAYALFDKLKLDGEPLEDSIEDDY